MRIPIKLNDAFWPSWLSPILDGNLKKDPRILIEQAPELIDDLSFSQAISAFKFGSTFKTTKPNRHAASDQLALTVPGIFQSIILDIGASDGITSLDLMRQLGFQFKRYYVTDYNLTVQYLRRGRRYYFFDAAGACILIAGPLFVSYPQESGFVRWLHRAFLRKAPKRMAEAGKLELIHPALSSFSSHDDRIRIETYNIFDPWPFEQPHLVKIANVLNLNYFSPELIQQALVNVWQLLPEGGHLLVTENRQVEQAGLYQKEGNHFRLLQQAGPGVDIHQLILAVAPNGRLRNNKA